MDGSITSESASYLLILGHLLLDACVPWKRSFLLVYVLDDEKRSATDTDVVANDL